MDGILLMVAKRIAMFNHKGGVGKTLLTYHLGWTLTENQKRVLLVDGDSQVNLTAIALGTDVFDNYYDDHATKYRNIKDGVAPVFEGKPHAIGQFECPTALGNKDLFVLPGHLDLSTYEGQLSLAQETGGSLSVLRNLPGALNALISLIEEKYDISYTIIDLNPGLGALNQNLFLSTDAFIVPTNPDPFSIMAIKTLSDRVVRWSAWKSTSLPIYSDSLYPLHGGIPKFIGTVTSRFNKHSSKAARKFDERIKDIDETVKTFLLPRLDAAGMTFDHSHYDVAFKAHPSMGPGSPTSNLSLARIPDFQSLAQTASQFEVPVFHLNEDNLRDSGLGGSSLASALRNRDEFKTIFRSLSKKVEYIINA
jgi:chromosome partitioning protein